VVSTHLKNISQIGSFPQVGVKIESISNRNKQMIHMQNALPRMPESWQKILDDAPFSLPFIIVFNI